MINMSDRAKNKLCCGLIRRDRNPVLIKIGLTQPEKEC
jgi:hypothetical protein